MNSHYTSNTAPLPEAAFAFLPLGSVLPQGWLRRQLQIQADGQSGNLPDFWESLGPNSGWRGGKGESWERGPYFLDGYLPMAHLLQDQKMIDHAQMWVDWTLESQDALGLFGPMRGAGVDWWPLSVMLKALTQYYDVSGDERVIRLMGRFFRYMKNNLPHNRLRVWAIVRWADMALSIVWLYNRTRDPELLELAGMLRGQGYDWSWHFHDFAHTTKQAHEFPMRTHVVNNAMGVKTPAVQWLLTGWQEYLEAARGVIGKLDAFHGTAAGVFTGDEHYAGKNPTQGTEVCAVVEYMFSLENLIQLLGDASFGDRLEKIAYNALPGTFDEKMWAHQYDQQANQVLCTIARRHWTNNGDDSNVFGLEPNYGCCTANFHQGWPKLIANLWMATPDNGLAAVAYGPCTVTAKVAGGETVTLAEETDYPFGETVSIKVSAEKPVSFPIKLRIPHWARDASVSVNGQALDGVQSGEFYTVLREWSDGDVLELVFPMKVLAERRYHGSVTLTRGPLVYSLKIGERWDRIGGPDECPSYAVYPTTDWNYALDVDPENPEADVTVREPGDVIYGPEQAPVELKVRARKLPQWGLEDNQAGELPQSPVRSDEPVEEVTLIPYGCAKLRITEFPLLER